MAIIDRILKSALVIIMISIALVVVTNVFCRFVLNFSLSWADETAQILLVWLTFLGAALAIKDRSHYALNFLSDRLKGNFKTRFEMLSRLLSLFCIIVLLYESAIVTWGIRPWVMPATEISRAWVYAACPVGCVLMLVYAITGLVSSGATSKES